MPEAEGNIFRSDTTPRSTRPVILFLRYDDYCEQCGPLAKPVVNQGVFGRLNRPEPRTVLILAKSTMCFRNVRLNATPDNARFNPRSCRGGTIHGNGTNTFPLIGILGSAPLRSAKREVICDT